MDRTSGRQERIVFATSDAREHEVPWTLETLWTEVILGRCGMKSACHVLRDIHRTDAAGRRAWMDFMIQTISEWFPAHAERP